MCSSWLKKPKFKTGLYSHHYVLSPSESTKGEMNNGVMKQKLTTAPYDEAKLKKLLVGFKIPGCPSALPPTQPETILPRLLCCQPRPLTVKQHLTSQPQRPAVGPTMRGSRAFTTMAGGLAGPIGPFLLRITPPCTLDYVIQTRGSKLFLWRTREQVIRLSGS